jgi:hypothetical protein
LRYWDVEASLVEESVYWCRLSMFGETLQRCVVREIVERAFLLRPT